MEDKTKKINLIYFRGDTIAFNFKVNGISNLDSAYFTCKENTEDTTIPILQKSLEDGISKIEDGLYAVRISPEDTEKLKSGIYYYDLQIETKPDKFTIMSGILSLKQDITTPKELFEVIS